MPAVSVIVPVYKVEKYLDRCIESICNQTLADIQIILVDDGSPDQCPVMCDKYAENDKRIEVIHKENGGLASARNAGLRNVQGKYVFFCDSDDWLEPNGLELLLRKAEETEVDFIRFRAIRSGWPGMPDNSPCMLGKEREMPGGFYDKARMKDLIYDRLLITSELTFGPILGAWGSMYRTKFLESNKIRFDESILFSEDLVFSAQVVLAANSFYYIDTACVYHYFYNSNSISKSFQKERWQACKSIIQAADKNFRDCKDFDFSYQLMRLRWFCIMLALNEKNYLNSKQDKYEYCKAILQDSSVTELKINDIGLNVPGRLLLKMLCIKLKLTFIVVKI